jgi:DNA-binding HxlR family transcriptional regulator
MVTPARDSYDLAVMQAELPDPLAAALAIIGDRWSLLIVAALLDGPRRFGDLQRQIQGIAPNVLSGRLRALEQSALVVARPYSERPPRFVYELGESGRELADPLRLLSAWGARNSAENHAPLHSACGTPLQTRWWCPTCEEAIAGEEGEQLQFA